MSRLYADGPVNVEGLQFEHRNGTLYIRPVPFKTRCLWFLKRLVGRMPWHGNQGDMSQVFVAATNLKAAALVLHNFIGNKHPDMAKLEPEVQAALMTVRGMAR